MIPIRIKKEDYDKIKELADINEISIATVISKLLIIYYYTPVQNNNWLEPED